MDPKSILASKTLWMNIVGVPLFAWLVRHGVDLDQETQDRIILGAISAVNVLLRLVTSRGVRLPGAGAGSMIFALLLAGGLAACSRQEVQTAESLLASAPAALQAACSGARTSVALAQGQLRGGALDTANELAAYVTTGCATVEGLNALLAEPSSAEWLGTVEAAANTLVMKPAS